MDGQVVGSFPVCDAGGGTAIGFTARFVATRRFGSERVVGWSIGGEWMEGSWGVRDSRRSGSPAPSLGILEGERREIGAWFWRCSAVNLRARPGHGGGRGSIPRLARSAGSFWKANGVAWHRLPFALCPPRRPSSCPRDSVWRDPSRAGAALPFPGRAGSPIPASSKTTQHPRCCARCVIRRRLSRLM